MDQVFIFIIAGIAWAFQTWWKNAQKSHADDTKRGSAAPSQPATEADQRYREIQAEIRRRIAERAGLPPGAPVAPPPPANLAPIPRSPTALPPIGRPIPPVARPRPAARPAPVPAMWPKPVAQPPVPVARPAPAMAAATPAPASVTPQPSLLSDIWAEGTLPSIQDSYNAAYAGDTTARLSALRTALATPAAARQAFLLREIFDRPLCLRPVSSGGHEEWN